jgi:uncharacterized Fe-S cluster-containing protein
MEKQLSFIKKPLNQFLIKWQSRGKVNKNRRTTCLAFAAAVFKGQKRVDQCPYVDAQIVEQFGEKMKADHTAEIENEKKFEELKNRIKAIDLPAIAEKLGGRFVVIFEKIVLRHGIMVE